MRDIGPVRVGRPKGDSAYTPNFLPDGVRTAVTVGADRPFTEHVAMGYHGQGTTLLGQSGILGRLFGSITATEFSHSLLVRQEASSIFPFAHANPSAR